MVLVRRLCRGDCTASTGASRNTTPVALMGRNAEKGGGRRRDDRVVALGVSAKAMPQSPAREVGREG